MDNNKNNENNHEIVSLLIYVVLLYFIANFMVGIIVTRSMLEYDKYTILYTSNIASSIIIGVPIPFWLRQRRLLFLKRCSIGKEVVIVIVGLIVVLAINICFTSIVGLFNYNEVIEDNIKNNIEYGGSLWFQLLGIAIAPAISEELIFRGVIFSAARVKMNFWFAAMISSVLFGIAHGISLLGLTTFFVGVFLCYIYEKTKNIVISMCIHFMNNFLSIMVVYLLNDNNKALDLIKKTNLSSTEYLIIGVIAVLLIVALVFLIKGMMANSESNKNDL